MQRHLRKFALQLDAFTWLLLWLKAADQICFLEASQQADLICLNRIDLGFDLAVNQATFRDCQFFALE